MGAKSFTDLRVWQETYALDQLLRAVDSVGSTIAEGFGRRTSRDKVHFYTMAFASGEEVKHRLLVSKGRKLVEDLSEALRSVQSLSKMLRRLIDGIVREDFT